jgi:adenylate cyclase
MDPHDIDVHIENTRGSLYEWVRNKSGHTIKDLPLYDGLLPQSNIPVISRSTPHSGYLNMQQPVKDAVVRWVPTVVRFQENLYAPFSLKVLSVYLNSNISVDLDTFGIENIRLGNIPLPVDYKGRMLINYRGPEKTFPHISVTDILENRVDPEQIRNKIVLIGATATGINDLRATPFSNIFPGVEIQSNIIDNLLQQDFLKRPDWHEFYNLLAIIFSGIVLGFALARVRILMGVVLTLSYVICYLLFTELLFVKMGILLNIIYPFTVMVLIYIGITLYQYATVERKRTFIKKAFSTYLSPNVVEQLIKTPEKLVLGGEKTEITAFFSDIEGFTPISEKLAPEALVELLNEFLTEMGDIIIANSGTMTEFPGDGIVAMFGAPVPLENHEQSACNACIQMQQRLETLREKWQQEINLTIRMRIGLCSGPAVVGNVGSKKRFSYGMIGDTVNAASRLEGVNKVYGTYTIISGDTYNNIKGNIVVRKLDTVKVVGKDESIDIYEVIGYAEDVDESMNSIFDLYAKGLLAYQNQNWRKAMGYFKKALEIRPQDAPSKTMYTRCEDYIVNPPPPDWDGAYVMKSK